MSKENVYDEQISPLVHQIIEICKEHNIALLLSAQLQDEDDETLYCTSILPGDEDVSDERFVQALNIIRPPSRSVMHMTTTHADGSQTLTAII
jgi:hypothetical protein